MTLTLFEGPAGSGKTTRLFRAVAEHTTVHPLQPDQRVLALTKMHGSRRRMLGKLSEELAGGGSFECSTLNGFALGLVQRWRSLARTMVDPLPADTDFAGLAAVANKLLEHESVVHWVAARHPLLVVDELQDLRDSELGVIKGLAGGLQVLCAADEFQELTPQGSCEGVDWAHAAGTVVTLDQVHRTSVAALLAAARSVRSGTPPVQGTGFTVLAAPNANVAASQLARNLTWAGGAQVAVLSPARPVSSPFVRDAFSRLKAKPFKKDGKSFGPFTLPWETSTHDELKIWEELLGLDGDDRVVTAAEITAHETRLPGPLIDWVRSRGRLAGDVAFPADQVREQLERAMALVRAHTTPRQLVRTGLTIHQAKNREFDRVVVLWPVQVSGDNEVQRRLLYNAITRAKYACVVIVQDPNPRQSRTRRAPFA